MFDLTSLVGARDAAAIAGWRAGECVPVGALRERAAAWRALALRTAGQSVALYLDDSLEFSAALIGAWQAGKTVWLTADTLDASCVALDRSVDAFFGQFPARWNGLLPAACDACNLPWQAVDADFPALVVHTSGSSGAPQAIPKRLGQMMAEVRTLELLFGAQLGAAEIIATVSHQHIYGLLFKVLWPLASGRAIHAISLDYPEQLALELGRRPCVLVASPAHLKRLPRHLDWAAAAACLRAVFSSGGPLAPEAGAATIELLGQLATEIYGSSETGGIAWRRRQLAAPGAWEAMPGVEWRIAGGGQLEVRSAHLEHGGWLLLEDRVAASAGGHFMLLGRADRIVKIEEKRVSLDAIEAALLATGLASEARVIVCPAEGGQRQVLAAFIVMTGAARAALESDGKNALTARLRAHLGRVAEAVAIPRRWRYLEQLPCNAQGKTTQVQLLALLGVEDPRARLPRVRTLEQDAERVLLELTVPASLFYFDGHFTQAPVLPGVVQVDWAILFGRRHFALPADFRGINALKFQQVIGPEVPVMLELKGELAPEGSQGAQGILTFRYFSDAGQHAGGRILFGS